MPSEIPSDSPSHRLDLELGEACGEHTALNSQIKGRERLGEGPCKCEGWVEVAEQMLWGELSLHSPDYRSPNCREIDDPLASVKEIILLPKYKDHPLGSVY